MARKRGKAKKRDCDTGTNTGQIEHREPEVQTPAEPDLQIREAIEKKRAELRDLEGRASRAAEEAAEKERQKQAAEQEKKKFWPKNKALPKAAQEIFWPEKKNLPAYHYKRRAQPCPECRRVLLDSGAQAAVCTSSGPKRGENGETMSLAFYRCRACGHRWQLPIREV